jgi:glutamate--cysteine ligase
VPDRLTALLPMLTQLSRGIEKESLRVHPDGTLALTPHPAALGAALTHPHVTTDFSESQLELITGVSSSAEACVEEITRIHRAVYQALGDEMLWCASMPCRLPREEDIPIGRYGTSNVGRAKTVYRRGLALRYGRRMQTICGIHYNFSVPPEAIEAAGFHDANTAYFALIRNFRRHGWILSYLFGASPAVCGCFIEGRRHALEQLAPGTWYLPHATSLRMGRLGYLSEAQDALEVSYNDLSSYAASLSEALTTPYPAYEAMGVRDGNEWRQLAPTLLQIENEFYSTIRPKRVIRPGERPLHALRERGVQYVEVRSMDLDPFEPVGISAATMRFLDAFLLHCLLRASPPDTPEEIRAIGRNKHRVAARGREPGLTLDAGGHEGPLAAWAAELLDGMAPVAAALDRARGGALHERALAAARDALDHPEHLPSARMLAHMRERYDGSYFRFVLDASRQHAQALRAAPLEGTQQAAFEALAAASLDKQRAIEAADVLPFDRYLERYLAPASLEV